MMCEGEHTPNYTAIGYNAKNILIMYYKRNHGSSNKVR